MWDDDRRHLVGVAVVLDLAVGLVEVQVGEGNPVVPFQKHNLQKSDF